MSVLRALRWAALAAFCLLPVVGCGTSATTASGGKGTEGSRDGKDSRDNKGTEPARFSKAAFDKVLVGMTPDQVEKLLGKPTTEGETDLEQFGLGKGKGHAKNWQEGDTTYRVTFKDDKVVFTDTYKK